MRQYSIMDVCRIVKMATYFLLNIKTKEVFAIKSLQKDLFVQEDGLEYSYSKVPTLPDMQAFFLN